MCIYGHFDTGASNGPEPLFQQCSSRMSDSKSLFCRYVRTRRVLWPEFSITPTELGVHLDFIVDLEHIFCMLLRTCRFCAEVNYNMTTYKLQFGAISSVFFFNLCLSGRLVCPNWNWLLRLGSFWWLVERLGRRSEELKALDLDKNSCHRCV